MKRICFNICLSLCLILFGYVNFGNAQGNPSGNPMYKSFEDFNKMVNFPSKKLLFRLVKSEGPNFIGFVYTEINTDGKAFAYTSVGYSNRHGQYALLNEKQINELKQKLIDFVLLQTPKDVKPKDNEPYFALVFQNGEHFVRLSFIDKVPNEIQEILDFLKAEFEKAEKERPENPLLKPVPLGKPPKTH